VSPVILQLTLPGYRILRVVSNDLMRVELEVLDTPRSCPYCAAAACAVRADIGAGCGIWRRLASNASDGALPAVLVRDCDVSFVQPLPGILPGRIVRSRIATGSTSATMTACRLESGASGVDRAATVGRIYAQFTQRKASERLSVDCPTVLASTSIRSTRPALRTTFCDLKRRRVFDIAPVAASRAATFLTGLRGRDKVRVVCIDLSRLPLDDPALVSNALIVATASTPSASLAPT